MHAASARARAPILMVRCADVDEAGIDPRKFRRLLSDCDGGVLLLKGIDDLPPREQSALLRVLRDQAFAAMPARGAAANVRIIATATQVLDSAIRDGRFRADLFYALAQVVLSVPGLAERRSDIPSLVAHFARSARGVGRTFSPEGIVALQEATWPGNVGELRSVVERASTLSLTPQIPATLVRSLLRSEAERELSALNEARRRFEHEYLVHVLETTGGNITRAAQIAQRNRTEFYKLLARHNIDPVRFKSA
jgi:two-component system, NtrC family, response regulator GlrR